MAVDIYWISRAEPARLAIMPRPRSGEWLRDEISGWANAGLDTVLSLLEAPEIHELGLSEESSHCEEFGIEFVSFPIPDRGTPKSIRDTAALVARLVDDLHLGKSIAIHCRAGIGRSGLIAGCVLLKLGVSVDEVFQAISVARGVPVPDTIEQVAWLEVFRRESACI